LDRLQGGIEVSELAKTFRDAIAIVTALHISLLWIDSLCILQSGPGAEDDWQKHLREMSTIYSNCWINIAADSGESAEDGCFMTRDPDTIKPLIFNMPDTTDALMPVATVSDTTDASTPVATAPEENARLVFRRDFWTHSLINTPLFKRGWVHQERLLSRRILRFSTKQLFWECQALRACETFPRGIPQGMRTESVPFSTQEVRNDPSWRRGLHVWFDIVESYSMASITNPADKLAAISGVAESACRASGTGYVAGLLENSLPISLYWKRGGLSVLKVAQYRAPSWSWASCDGWIRFPQDLNVRGEALCTIDRIWLDHRNPNNPFGQLKGGHLVISACVLQTGGEYGNKVSLIYAGTSFQFPPAPFRAAYDESSVAQDRTGRLLITIACTERLIFGLVIIARDNETWMRIGVFEWAFRVHELAEDALLKVKAWPKSTFKLV
jgi:hypothetical protein